MNAMDLVAKTVEAQPLQNITQKPSLCLPTVLMLKAFSYLSLRELGDCRQLSKECRTLVCEQGYLLRAYAARALGKRRWSKYLGEIGEEPPLPKNIHAIMQAACPIWEGKKVIETHLLVLIPKNVNKRPLTINSLGELVKAPKEGQPTSWDGDVFWKKIVEQHGDRSVVDKTHWVLMTKNILPGSTMVLTDEGLYYPGGGSYEDQCALIEDCSLKAEAEYFMPKVIEVAVCVFMKYFSSGKRLYASDSLDHTRCQEKLILDKKTLYLSVGHFSSQGLRITDYFEEGLYYGVAALRKL